MQRNSGTYFAVVRVESVGSSYLPYIARPLGIGGVKLKNSKARKHIPTDRPRPGGERTGGEERTSGTTSVSRERERKRERERGKDWKRLGERSGVGRLGAWVVGERRD